MEQESMFPTTPRNKRDLSNFEEIDDIFFSSSREALLTVNVNKISVNAVSARLLPDVRYMKILFSREEQKIALEPCDRMYLKKWEWAKEKNGKRYGAERIGKPFVLAICKLMGWNPDYRYQIKGEVAESVRGDIMIYDLTNVTQFEKAAKGKTKRGVEAFLERWDGHFGPKYSENKRELKIDTFDSYVVMSEDVLDESGAIISSQEKEHPQPEGENADG